MSFHSYLRDCKVENIPDSNKHTAFLPGGYGATLGFVTLQQKMKVALERKLDLLQKFPVEIEVSQWINPVFLFIFFAILVNTSGTLALES